MAKILVVDDERMVCDLLRAVLSRHGHEVLTATSGEEGVETFRQNRPTVTMLDLRMPGMDGIATLKRIRAMDPQAAVMVLTAWGTDDLENQARALGVTDFLKKGFSLDVLVGALERVAQQSAKAPAKGCASGPSEPEPVRESILIVDDESLIRDMLSQFLSLRGYRVRAAQNGAEALAMVEQEPPGMIILDMYMPGMNGLEVLIKLRAKEYRGGVVALTASQDEALLQQILELGSVDVMGKPVDLERLALVIQVGLTLAA
ncbi:MAG: response regulator [Nitrospirales bacterium]